MSGHTIIANTFCKSVKWPSGIVTFYNSDLKQKYKFLIIGQLNGLSIKVLKTGFTRKNKLTAERLYVYGYALKLVLYRHP